MFQLGSAEPTTKCREILAAVAEVVKEQDTKIAIEGHTDAAPFRGDQITTGSFRQSSLRRKAHARDQRGRPLRVPRRGLCRYGSSRQGESQGPQNRRISIILLQPRIPPLLRPQSRRKSRPPSRQRRPRSRRSRQGPGHPNLSRNRRIQRRHHEAVLPGKEGGDEEKEADVMGLWD